MGEGELVVRVIGKKRKGAFGGGGAADGQVVGV